MREYITNIDSLAQHAKAAPSYIEILGEGSPGTLNLFVLRDFRGVGVKKNTLYVG